MEAVLDVFGHVVFIYTCTGILLIGSVIWFILSTLLSLKFKWIILHNIFKPKRIKGSAERFNDFNAYGIPQSNARSFFIENKTCNALIGTWHLLPYVDRQSSSSSTPIDFDLTLDNHDSCEPIFLYFHGNSHTRSYDTRIETYKLLSSFGYHVIAFDYKGYGDSTVSTQCESDCVRDSLTVLAYLQQKHSTGPLFFYGHSLGTGVVASVMRVLMHDQLSDKPALRLPTGIVLDAPVRSMQSVIGYRYRWMTPLFLGYLLKSLDVMFDSENNLDGCPVPVLVVHAEDDRTVPFPSGLTLVERLTRNSLPDQIQFIRLSKGMGYLHNRNYSAPELIQTIPKFIDQAIDRADRVAEL